MFGMFASIFGELLSFLYNFIGNYGASIILFSIIVKLILLPMSIKQQKSMKQANKMQEEMIKIQEKYGNDKEKINQEIIELYKKTGTSPFSGCFISIIQFLLIISVFIMVKSPLTYVKKVDVNVIDKYKTELKEKKGEEANTAYPEIAILREFGAENEQIYLNMDFLGIDLSAIPTDSNSDIRAWIIPILYVLTSIVSMKLTTNTQRNKNEKENEKNDENQMAQMNKTMMYMVPIMSVSIAIIAPLGLALYWFMSNVLAIVERLVVDKFQKQKEEVQ